MRAIRRAWVRRVVLALAAVGVAVALAYLIAPAIARWRLQSWLIAHGERRVRIEEVELNPFTLDMTVHTLVAEGPGEAGLRWKRVDVNVGFWPLWKRRIEVRQLALSDAVITVELSPKGVLTVGGLELGPGSTTWEVGLANVDLRDVRLDYRGPRLSQQVTIVSARMDHLKTWQPQVPTRFQAELRTAGGTVRLDGRAEPLGEERSTTATVQIRQLQVGWLAPLLSPAGLQQLRGVLHADLDVAARSGDKGAFHARLLGGVGADGMRAATAAQHVEAGSMGFKGKVTLTREAGARTSTLEVKGTLSSIKVSSAVGSAGPAVAMESLSWTGKLDGGAGAIHAGGDVEAKGAQLHDDTAGLTAAIDSVSWSGNLEKAAGGLHAGGDLGGRNVSLADSSSGRQLARVGAIAADTLSLDTKGVRAATLRLQSVQLLQRPPPSRRVDPEPAFVATSSEITARNLEVLLPARVVLDTLHIDGLAADIVRDADGKLQPAQLLPRPARPSGKPAPPWSAAVSNATLGGTTAVTFRDRSVHPDVVLRLDNLRATISRLDTAAPKRSSPVTLRTRIGKYSRLEASGTISPFVPKLTANVSADLAALSLPPLNGYIGDLIGYHAASGRLDMKLRLGARGGTLDGTAKATLEQLRVEALPNTAAYRKLNEQLPMPLPNALSLIRGKDGDITLDLTISGDVSAPNVDFSSVMRTAVANALKRGALVVFAPLGAALEARKLAGRLTALRFNPVTFSPGSTTLPQAAESYLTKMAAILQQHPDTRVVLCGKAVEEDRTALQAAARAPASMGGGGEQSTGAASAATSGKGGSGGGKQAAPNQAGPAGPPVTKQALLDLATKRAAAVKGFLVAHGVAAERLFLCAPEIDESPGATPRVEISA